MGETDRIQMIPLDQIEPHPANRKIGGFDEAKLGQLAESIKAVGVQQPAIVRLLQNHPIEEGSLPVYQLVAGERRWRASRIAGYENLPCIVRELDDITVLKIQTIENLQRDDVHPLDEADGYNRLIAHAGYTIEMLASDVGKSTSYIYQRMKLNSLVNEARKLFVENAITAGHAILLARLGQDQQREILGTRLFHYNEIASVRELDAYIHNQIMLDLSKTSWKLDDADLLPEVGSCRECARRTGYQPELFADVCNGGKKDYCMDRACFTRKQDRAVELKRASLAGQDVLEVIDGYVYYREQPKNALENWQWSECKKSAPGAKKMLVVAGKQPGRVTYGVVHQKSSRYQESPEEKEKTRKRKAAQKAAEEIRVDKINAILDASTDLDALPLEALRVVVKKIWARWWNNHRILVAKAWSWIDKRDDTEGKGNKQIDMMDAEQLNRLLLHIVMSDEIKFSEYEKPVTKTIDALMVIFGVEVQGGKKAKKNVEKVEAVL